MSDHANLKDQVELLITPAKDVTNVTLDEKYDGKAEVYSQSTRGLQH